MSSRPTIEFVSLEQPKGGVLVVLSGKDVALPDSLGEPISAFARRVAAIGKFKGKSLATADAVAPEELGIERLVLVGTHSEAAPGEEDWLKIGGVIAAGTKGAETVTVLGGDAPADKLALGVLLRAYEFDRYKTKKGEKKDEEPQNPASTIRFVVADVEAAKAAFDHSQALADGVTLARDLVNEPANVLTTVEYANRIAELSQYGVDVEILDEAKMAELKMHALLGVSLGSPTPPRLVVMRWNGADSDEAPVAFVGKGVVFDTGGISIKPAAGMDEMKGDMGGSAAVVGLMRTLAARNAKVNVVGVVGLVENAVDGKAQRPGDIVTAMSGTTIEVLNTDAEGRLVLADALWYTQERFKPRFMVNLATLTGAIIVALGHHHAGLFSNNDELAERLSQAGIATGEKVWRLPLSKEYDKLIEGKFADIKNIGSGRAAGSITAAQFLQRFVNDVPWAHLDVAGTAMSSPASEYNRSWGSGFGVRLLDRLVAEHYEAK